MRRLLGALLASAFATTLLLWPLHGALLDWDEVAYANAARLGFWSHYTERGTLSYSEFMDFVSAKRTKTRPKLPEGFEEEQSPVYARRAKPPFVSYLLSLVADSKDERVLRSVQLVGAVALAAAMLFAYATLSRERTRLGLTLVSLASVWIGWYLFAEISMHGWAAVFVATSAALTVRWLDTRRPRDGVLLAASVALTAVALQTALFVLFAVVVSVLLLEPEPLRRRALHVLLGTALVGLFFVAFWPGSVLTSAFIRIPAHYAYAIQRGQEYAMVPGERGTTAVWRSVLPALLLTPIALAYLARVSRASLGRVAPYAIIGVTYTLLIGRFALGARYVLPGMAALSPIVALAADHLVNDLSKDVSRNWAKASAIQLAALAAALVAFLPAWGVRPTAEHDPPLRQDLAWMTAHLGTEPAYLQGGHIYAHYLAGQGHDIRTIRVDREGLNVREQGYYRTLEEADVRGARVGIKKKRGRYTGALDASVLAGCRRTELAALELYDCTRTATLTGARQAP